MTPETSDRSAKIANLIAARQGFLRFVQRRVGSRADAEDVLQTAFANVLERAGTLRRGDAVVAWFYRVLRNTIADQARRRAVRHRVPARSAGETTVAPDLEFERNVCTCVLDELDDVRPDYAEILRRVEIEERSLGDVARALGITVRNARVRLHRARRALRGRLELVCRTCAEHGCLDCTCRRRRARAASEITARGRRESATREITLAPERTDT